MYVKFDKFNDEANDGNRTNSPIRGGELKVRFSSNPVILNPLLSNDQPSNTINGYIFDYLVNRDPESLENRPWLAESWEIRDVVELQNGNTLSGKVVSQNDANVTLEPITTKVVGTVDTVLIDEAAGVVKLKNGEIIYGKMKKTPNTVIIDTKILNQNSQVIAIGEIKQVQRKIGDRIFNEPAVLKNSMFIFNIRKGIKWHDSTTDKSYFVTADDVIFSYNAIMNPYVDAQVLRAYYSEVSSLKKIDDYSVSFVFSKPYYAAFEVAYSIPIIPAHRYKTISVFGDPMSFGREFNRHPDNKFPIGTGPYKFSKWDFSKMIVIERNNDYWASKAGLSYWHKDQPFLDRILFIIISNNASALKALMKGEVDVDPEIEPSTWIDPETNSDSFKSKFIRASEIGLVYTYIGWNAKSPFFEDKRVRQAMTMLIPIEKILLQIHFGLGSITTGPFFPNSPEYNKSLRPYPYSPERAAQLLTEAGWIDIDGDGIREKNGIKFEFEYLIHSAKDYHQRIADIIKEHVEQAGIKMLIRKLDWGIFTRRLSKQMFDAVRLAWGISIDPDPFQVWHSSQSGGRGSNYINFNNPEADKILETARQTFDSRERWKMYRRFHEILYDEQPYTFLFNLNSLIFYSKKFRGVKLYYSSTPYYFVEWYLSGIKKTDQQYVSYNLIGLILLAFIGGIVYFFVYKIKRIYSNKV